MIIQTEILTTIKLEEEEVNLLVNLCREIETVHTSSPLQQFALNLKKFLGH